MRTQCKSEKQEHENYNFSCIKTTSQNVKIKTYGRWSFQRIEPQGLRSLKGSEYFDATESALHYLSGEEDN